MIQVKAFDEEHEDDLTLNINEFIITNDLINIIDIKFSTSIAIIDEDEQIYCFSALLIYMDNSL
ncbi:MAG: sporulation protein Cse60 [Erysipelotrichaceae bacterium]